MIDRSFRLAARLGLAVLTSLSLATAAAARSESVGGAGGWALIYTETDSGAKICSAAKFFPTGEWVMIDRADNGLSTLTLYAPNAPETPKDQGVAGIVVNVTLGGEARSIAVAEPGYPVTLNEDEGVVIALEDDLRRALSSGSDFSVSYAEFTSATLSLENYARALGEIDDCVADHF